MQSLATSAHELFVAAETLTGIDECSAKCLKIQAISKRNECVSGCFFAAEESEDVATSWGYTVAQYSSLVSNGESGPKRLLAWGLCASSIVPCETCCMRSRLPPCGARAAGEHRGGGRKQRKQRRSDVQFP
eukprot:SAG31_NODE_4808_length_2945_cov_2.155306_5_plen_131_part_00